MRKKTHFLFISCALIALVVLLEACKRATTVEPPQLVIIPRAETQTETPISTGGKATETIGAPTTEAPYPYPDYPTIPGTGIPYPQPSDEATFPEITTTLAGGYPPPLATHTQAVITKIQASQTQVTRSVTPTTTYTLTPTSPGVTPSPTVSPENIYPGPETPYYPAYPGPDYTATSNAYPGPETPSPQVTQTPRGSASPTAVLTSIAQPSMTPTMGTGTPMMTPTEIPPRPPISPPPPGSHVSIWHSWGIEEGKALQEIVQSFQRLYPDVTLSLQFIPLDDLYQSFYKAGYLGQGPGLLLGPSKWGAGLFDEDLISNLSPYVSDDFLKNINPIALASGEYRESLISLPLSQHGLLLFRNTSIISEPPSNFDMLISLSHAATHGGAVGSYLERGSFFSSPAIIGLGGRLMDQDGFPAFNDKYGLEWIGLLEAYDEAGAVTFNTNWDLEKFKQARVGLIIDGSWNIFMLAQSIGAENLAIDPWPAYGTGYMSGWVETDNVFLNANTKGNDRFAALSFMGYLLDPNVQVRLAEVRHIPSVMTTQPRDVLVQQAMLVFSKGVPYPHAVDDHIFRIYRNELDKAIRDVFERGIDPKAALQAADQNIRKAIAEIRSIP